MMQNQFGSTGSFSVAPDAVRTFIQRVYQWMGMGLALTGWVAMMTASNTALLKMMLGGGFWIIAIAEIALVFWLSASITKISVQAATIGFLVYSALNGLTLSYIFLAYTGASIGMVFFLTAGTFAGVSLFGWATKTDLSSMRGFLIMGLWGLILASILNAFFYSSTVELVLSYVGVAIFIGLTAYDTQRLKMLHHQGGGTPQLAIMGALMLYLDFINMFIYLLRIFGRRK